jgi:ribosomal protein S18 acetylase RimI-like enzyme
MIVAMLPLSTDGIRLRPASAADLERAARIWHEGWWDAHSYLAPKLGPSRTLESFLTRMRQRLPNTTVAEGRDGVVGFAVVVGDELEQLYVDPSVRGRGVARELIAHAERQVAAAGFRAIWLAVATENHRAQAFYRKSGWRQTLTFEYEAETADAFVPVTCHRYERTLAEA